MEPEIQPPQQEAPPAEAGADAALAPTTTAAVPEPWETRTMRRILLGNQGLRAGWSLLVFFSLSGFPGHAGLFNYIVGFTFYLLHLVGARDDFTASSAFFGELISFLALLGTAALMALIERRRNLLAYNLTGPRRIPHFLSGLAAGFLSLSLLVGALAWGHWLQFGPIALSGAQIYKFAALWALVFLLVGCVEEGIFRCYLQFTLTRGINFWWALGTVGAVSLFLIATHNGNGASGVYAAALLGLLPCLILHKRKAARSAFWQAAWVTSTLFGFIHTSNPGEDWIGIFAAAFVGFVFCVSVRLTGSAWWAIGCHAAWDWAQTYFYGTADSGMVATGHYMTASPAGNALWSGGADGPEGSMLVLGILLLLLVALVVIYGRKKPAQLALVQAKCSPN